MLSKLNSSQKKNPIPDRTFEVSFSYEQYQVIRSLLPKGYSLKERKKKKKLSFSMSNPIKKVHFERATSIYPSESIQPNTKSLKIALPNESLTESEINKINQLVSDFKALSEWQRICYKNLLFLKRNPLSKPFLFPVDYIALKIPDYPIIIKKPMDISTVENNLLNYKYNSFEDFENDIDLIWKNALTYNPKGTKIHDIALALKDYYHDIKNEIKKNRENTEKKIEKMILDLDTCIKMEGILKNEKNINNNKNFRKNDLMENFSRLSAYRQYGILQKLGNYGIEPQTIIEISINQPLICQDLYNYTRKSAKQEKIREENSKIKEETSEIKETSSNSSFITDSDISFID